MKQMIQIRCKNNKKTLKVATGSTLSDIFSQLDVQMPYPPVSAKVNNKVEGLHYRVYNPKDIEYLDVTSSSGIRAYTRTLFFVLCKAVMKGSVKRCSWKLKPYCAISSRLIACEGENCPRSP